MSDEITKEIDLSGLDFSSIELNGVSYDSNGNRLSSSSNKSTTKLFQENTVGSTRAQSNAVEAVELNKILYPINDPTEAQAREADITEVKGLITQEANTRQTNDTLLSGDISSLDNEIRTLEADMTQLQNRINAIKAMIPPQASSENQLADKDFVNSSISTNTANFIGTFTSLEELEAQTATNNDYAFLQTTDSSGNIVYKRYKYSSETSSWMYEYDLNNSSFTAEQWATINSGLTADVVVANPELEGDEEYLKSMGIKGTNYRLGGGSEEKTLEEYEALPEREKTSGTLFCIPDAEATDITMIDDNVITENTTWSSAKISQQSGVINITQARYNALTQEEKAGRLFNITDAPSGIIVPTNTVESGNMNPVTSNAVNGALTNVITTSNLMSNTMKFYENKDLNTIGKAIGYFITCTNAPCNYGMGISLDFGSDLIQIIVRVDPTTPVIFIRAKASGNWGSWRQI